MYVKTFMFLGKGHYT